MYFIDIYKCQYKPITICDFLSFSNYLHVNRRTAIEYRKERFHRLIIPALFLLCFKDIPATLLKCKNTGFEVCFHQLSLIYSFPWKWNPGVTWFLYDMYIYSQLFLVCFLKWHPNHGSENTNENNQENQASQKVTNLKNYAWRPFGISFIIPPTPDIFTSCMSKILIGPIKLILIPSLILSMIEICLRRSFPGRFAIWSSWCDNFHHTFLYVLGYTLISIWHMGIDSILIENGLLYLVSGSVVILLQIATILMGGNWIGGIYGNMFLYPSICVLRGFGEWMFMVGLYGTLNRFCKSNTTISVLREMAMPFYLLHSIVIALVINANIAPVTASFDSFLRLLILSTLISLMISFMIIKSPGFVRYFFGLPSRENVLFGQWLKGYGPFVFLLIIRFMESMVANYSLGKK